MKYGIREVDSTKTKILKIITGVVGSLICAGTLGLGAVMGMTLPLVGGLLILGIVPIEVVLTCVSVKNTLVETISEELVQEYYVNGNEIVRVSFYAIGDEIIEGPFEEVVAEKINGKFVYFDSNVKETEIKLNKNVDGPIQFTNITPVNHSYDEEPVNNLTKKRVIEFKPNKKGSLSNSVGKH